MATDDVTPKRTCNQCDEPLPVLASPISVCARCDTVRRQAAG